MLIHIHKLCLIWYFLLSLGAIFVRICRLRRKLKITLFIDLRIGMYDKFWHFLYRFTKVGGSDAWRTRYWAEVWRGQWERRSDLTLDQPCLLCRTRCITCMCLKTRTYVASSIFFESIKHMLKVAVFAHFILSKPIFNALLIKFKRYFLEYQYDKGSSEQLIQSGIIRLCVKM